MNKTLTALVAAATLAGSLAGTPTTASAQGRGFLPGLIVGGIVGGADRGRRHRTARLCGLSGLQRTGERTGLLLDPATGL